ncbi:binding partner of ACD11 1, partial [Melia azedarach]
EIKSILELSGTVIIIYMSSPDLTIRVLGLAPRVTLQELNTFFSYCGTVHNIQLQSCRNKDLSQTALVTFAQPYAFQTALLLNDAIFAGQPIRVLPVKDSPISDKLTTDTKMNGIIPAAIQEIAWKGSEVLKKTKEEIEETYKLSEKGRFLMEQTRSLIYEAEQAALQIGSKYISTTANWLSTALDKVNSNTRKRNNPNSRKQK